MANPTQATIKRLFNQSGEFCTYPKCDRPVVDRSTGTIMAEVCHINARSSGGPRYDPSQTDKERNAYDNLILLCAEHHKLVDAQPQQYSAERLRAMKEVHEQSFGRAEQAGDTAIVRLLQQAYIKNISMEHVSGEINVNGAKSVNIRTSVKKVTIAPAPGTIGADQRLVRYVEHLLKRYIEFASKDPFQNRTFNPGRFRKNLERKFRAHWKILSVEQADELIRYLQDCIDRTSIAKGRRSKGQRSYSTLQEYEPV